VRINKNLQKELIEEANLQKNPTNEANSSKKLEEVKAKPKSFKADTPKINKNAQHSVEFKKSQW
jgi:hypothetical protein